MYLATYLFNIYLHISLYIFKIRLRLMAVNMVLICLQHTQQIIALLQNSYSLYNIMTNKLAVLAFKVTIYKQTRLHKVNFMSQVL